MARKSPDHCVQVAVMAALRRPLTYRVPDGLEVRTGQRVLVPLGPRKAKGIVLEAVAKAAPGIKLRDIFQVLDPEPLLSPELLTLGLWISEYYVAPPGEVFRAMLPLLPQTRRAKSVALTPGGRVRLQELTGSLLEEARSGEEAVLLRHLAEHPSTPLDSLRRRFPSAQLIARAVKQGWIAVKETEEPVERRRVWSVRLAQGIDSLPVGGPLPERPRRMSPVAQRIVETLQREGPARDHRELLKSARGTLAHLRKLNEACVVELQPTTFDVEGEAEEGSLTDFGGSPARGSRAEQGQPSTRSGAGAELTLTRAQSAVCDDLAERLRKHEFSAVLLHGVTASGKTEIYLRLIRRCLEEGSSALMLVPEIALTPAMQSIFARRFGREVVVLHSALAAGTRHEEWWRAWRGEARVVLGTRSALFAPVSNLGLVIVDEEHDDSYKQQEPPRYHGRDVAVVRARLAKALVVLGSATPSLESYANAQKGKYELRALPERIGGRPMAAVEIVDMRQEFRQTFSKIPISRRLETEIEAQLRDGAQTLVLLNRRGYSWFLLCRSCGESVRCANCSVSLVYHRREHRLMCHYCGYSIAIPTQCPLCSSEYLYYVGEGTEKIEDKLREQFPAARIERLDRDIARRPGEYRRILSAFHRGQVDILIGTQLIAKGHDFPGVTLVGVVSADQGLGLPDFRAAERTFQLLTQVAGRAGRGDAPGRVLVQTFFPEHYAIKLASEQNFEAFFAKEMRFRRMMRYPPTVALANVIAQHAQLEKAAEIARLIGEFLKPYAREPDAESGEAWRFRVLGPAPAPLARIEGRYRIQFLLKGRGRVELNGLLRRLADHCDEHGVAAGGVIIDMDPVSIM